MDHFAGMPAAVLVRELYRGLLRREPDPDSQAKIDRLLNGTSNVEQILAEFFASAEYQSIQAKSNDPPKLINDQTQFGEFELLLKRWLLRAVKRPIVVDVGARGRERSNSYDLMKSFGWHGLLIEANPNLIESIRLEFSGLDVEIVHCAISNYVGRAKLFLGTNEMCPPSMRLRRRVGGPSSAKSKSRCDVLAMSFKKGRFRWNLACCPSTSKAKISRS